LNERSQYHAQYLGGWDGAEICCGQIAGLISRIDSAEQVVKGIVEKISASIGELKGDFAESL